jgi:hypothetical protein
MVPQPVKAVLLLFPSTDAQQAKRDSEDAKGNSVDLDPTIMWIKQTVSTSIASVAIRFKSVSLDWQCMWYHGPHPRFSQRSSHEVCSVYPEMTNQNS